ncbi:MAG: hypothetical protein ACRDL9_05210 [Trebonia sp.]
MNPQSPGPARTRAAAGITVMSAAALLAAACSASPPSAGPGGSPNAGGSNSPSAVAYSRCVRSHGVPEYPDPNSSGQLPKITPGNEAQLGVSESRFTAAQAACQHLWPYQAPTQAQQRQILADDLKFAACMRSRGLPKFPDPTNGPDGPRFVIHVSSDGFNPNSPQILAKARACLRVLPAGAPQPSATVLP